MRCINFKGDGGVICCVLPPDGTDWKVVCTETSLQRMADWRRDEAARNFLKVLHCIPNILVPRSLPAEGAGHYMARPPGEGSAWFAANELDSLQALEKHHNMTVGDLWSVTAELCQTLARLYSLGVWGHAGRDSILLRKEPELGHCLTDITGYHIYKYPQAFPEIPCHTGEDTVTLGLRLLVGGMALCADQQHLLNGTETSFERQLGTSCSGRLRRFFRTPSDLPPVLFLENAQDELRQAVKCLRYEEPQKLCLYLVLLGSDCRQAAVPALNSVAYSFYHCISELNHTRHVQANAVCIYPWDSVHICRIEEHCAYSFSALDQEHFRRRPVLLGGLLDCLNHELERNQAQGTASLVCYISMPESRDWNTPQFTCMDSIFIQELAQKRELGIFEAFLCSTDLRQQADTHFSRLAGENMHIDQKNLDSEMYSAIARLLSTPRYFSSHT